MIQFIDQDGTVLWTESLSKGTIVPNIGDCVRLPYLGHLYTVDLRVFDYSGPENEWTIRYYIKECDRSE